eukprot:TRINITY_DN20471_c0_g1_i5.p1 TRINITY_DN20471_c0_g1~~TRINITY_DN20471_c0_g1_i5.p1  ORF type:complete len:349 (-),score=65.10 TRINITY_DN20471_c0_g1_i5:244-1290(-)
MEAWICRLAHDEDGNQAKFDKTWQELTKKEHLQKILVDFFDTKYEMFNDIVAEAEILCDHTIAENVRDRMLRSMLPELRARRTQVETEIFEACKDAWAETRKLWSSDKDVALVVTLDGKDDQAKVDVCTAIDAKETWEALTNKDKLEKELGDFLSTEIVMFNKLVAEAKEACKVGIADRVRDDIIQKVIWPEFVAERDALVEEISGYCKSAWEEKPQAWSEEKLYAVFVALQRGKPDEIFKATDAEETLDELIDTDRLKRRLAVFRDTRYVMFEEIVTRVDKAFDKTIGIYKDVRASVMVVIQAKMREMLPEMTSLALKFDRTGMSRKDDQEKFGDINQVWLNRMMNN